LFRNYQYFNISKHEFNGKKASLVYLSGHFYAKNLLFRITGKHLNKKVKMTLKRGFARQQRHLAPRLDILIITLLIKQLMAGV
jgi:hypothetical protein